jgi:hypothetical protein
MNETECFFVNGGCYTISDDCTTFTTEDSCTNENNGAEGDTS